MKVKCVGCDSKFDFIPENFSDHEIVFCPVCRLDHEKKKPAYSNAGSLKKKLEG